MSIDQLSENDLHFKEFETLAYTQGFDLVGYTNWSITDEEKNYISKWVLDGKHGDMDWFAKPQSMEIRLEGKHLGFKPERVICLGMLYRSQTAEILSKTAKYKVSRYALGRDYHTVIRRQAKPLLQHLKTRHPGFHFRLSVDSLPIPEKAFARKSGIGWMGKNTNLIHPKLGSYFFLSTILTDLPFSYEPDMITDHCGSCRACMDACPTQALVAPYQLDASLCISHHNIESKKPMGEGNRERASWLYGCDICQEVCPWNAKVAERNGVETRVLDYAPKSIFTDPNQAVSKPMSPEEFQEIFSDSAIYRIGVDKWNENIKLVL
ncbi:putative iron-sulfur cluster-binding protein [Leptospira ryugenii]|uniref:Putative iron-sulfur cluster-binding protein n=1 Tax=Leptospira ryugenii TaxID=1917863 RepID=A0A2P2E1Q8_9LEPT|nr:tRNA epoxyqueuosine(34) reductase QueG [Leptospira ryugenii]GBF50828.1 putative iron-sulfur cluster-binding protein [Leptospira ryugenii]